MCTGAQVEDASRPVNAAVRESVVYFVFCWQDLAQSTDGICADPA